MQFNHVICHSRTMNAMAAQGQLPTQDPKPGGLETLQGVRNDPRNAPLVQIDSRSPRSTVSSHTTMPRIASRIASGLCLIATLPLTLASADEGEAGGLIVLPSAGEIAVRSYGAAQLIRDNPAIATVALITTTVLALGSAFALLHSPMSTEGPSAQAQVNLRKTAMAACGDLIHQVPDAASVSIHTTLVSTLEGIGRGTDRLRRLANDLIRDGTQAPSLESLRERVEYLKEQRLEPLRNQLAYLTRALGMGGFDVDPIELQAIGGQLFASASQVDQIIRKVSDVAEILTTEIDRQRERLLPRIG